MGVSRDKSFQTKAIFKNYGSGVKTDRDDLVIDTTKENLIKKCKKAFSGDFDETFKKTYKIHNSSSYAFADKLKALQFDIDSIYFVNYRPFDKRFIYYKIGFTSRPAYETMKHFLNKENLGLCFCKFSVENENSSMFITDKMIETCVLVGNSGHSTIAPLYTYPDEFLQGDKTPNFTQEFSAFIAKHKVLKSKSPEQILAFIYANLYNPAYRAKYIEYLKIGFPRIDFEVGESKFESLANLGQNLIDLHLTKTIPKDKEIDLKFRESAGKSNPIFTLDKPKYEPNLNKIIVNADLEIIGISQEVWDYTIGGYKVLDKWLKYRANDKNGAITLSQADFTHILNVAKILKATIAIQAQLTEI